MYDEDSTKQAHVAFIYELERLNNASSADKIDKYPRPIDVTDSFNISKASQYNYNLLFGFGYLIFCSVAVHRLHESCCDLWDKITGLYGRMKLSTEFIYLL